MENTLESLILDYNKDKKVEEQLSLPKTEKITCEVYEGKTYLSSSGKLRKQLSINGRNYNVTESQTERKFLIIPGKIHVVTIEHCIAGKTAYIDKSNPNGFGIHTATVSAVSDIAVYDNYSNKQQKLLKMEQEIDNNESLTLKERFELKLQLLNMQ